MKRAGMYLVFPVVLIVLFCGCRMVTEESAAAPDRPKEIPADRPKEVRIVITRQSVLVAGKPTERSAIPRQLKALGIAKGTRIIVQPYAGVAQEVFVDVLNELKSAGYTNLSFGVGNP